MKNLAINSFFVMFMFAGITLGDAVADISLKCWINQQGYRECGNIVPPEYTQQGYEELTKGGFVRKKIDRSKTEKELEEEKRLAELEAKEKRKAEEQNKKDKMLLLTFSNVTDIERLRDSRIQAIDLIIKHTQTRNEKHQLDLDALINLKQTSDGASPNHILEKIASLKRQIKNNNDYIDKKRVEQTEIKQSYSSDIQRFKKIKGIE